MTAQHYYIEMQDLSKAYPRTLGDQLVAVARSIVGLSIEKTRAAGAVVGLTLKIRQGERVGIIGRNGAGKSTLLQMLAGITPPTSGSMTVNGKVTAVLTLGSGLRDDLSGRQNIYLEGETQGKKRKQLDIHVKEIIEFAELGKFIDMPLRTYSTGMKARLAFSMITQIEPEILIIDEALSVGDAAFALKARRRITELCKRGSIVLIVSHSMESIRELCNRCIWLDKGQLVLDGEPEVITRQYQESVRKEDDAGHTARFSSLIGEQSYKKGFALGLLSLSSDGRPVTRHVSGGYLAIRCKLEGPSNAPLGYAMLRCIRLDGALICENRIELGSNLEISELSVAYPRLNLAPGLYRFCLEWRDVSDEIRADSSGLLEVYEEKMQTGGRPILTQVGLVESVKINNNTGTY
jgi:lipopolysaccharide transport system ATP-binding protein